LDGSIAQELANYHSSFSRIDARDLSPVFVGRIDKVTVANSAEFTKKSRVIQIPRSVLHA
jgi:hypothetical protein